MITAHTQASKIYGFRAEVKCIMFRGGEKLEVPDYEPVGSETKRIFLANDGNGSMGNYDRLHVFTADGAHWVVVAEQVESWQQLDVPD